MESSQLSPGATLKPWFVSPENKAKTGILNKKQATFGVKLRKNLYFPSIFVWTFAISHSGETSKKYGLRKGISYELHLF